MGWFRWMLPVEPKKPASPKEKIPPSEATSQYPPSSWVGVMPTIGLASGTFANEPKACASPKFHTPPELLANQKLAAGC